MALTSSMLAGTRYRWDLAGSWVLSEHPAFWRGFQLRQIQPLKGCSCTDSALFRYHFDEKLLVIVGATASRFRSRESSSRPPHAGLHRAQSSDVTGPSRHLANHRDSRSHYRLVMDWSRNLEGHPKTSRMERRSDWATAVKTSALVAI